MLARLAPALTGRALVPVALFVGAGWLLRRRAGLDPRPLARAALYVFSPALLFSTLLMPRRGPAEAGPVTVYAIVMLAAGVAISRALGAWRRWPPAEQAGRDLTMAFSNSANLGLPMVTFSLGAQATRTAVLYVITQVVAVNTAGAYLAGRGQAQPRQALGRMLRLPALWAAAAGAGLAAARLAAPPALMTAARFGGAAYAPVVLMVLGATLADWGAVGIPTTGTWLAAGVRLGVMPVAGAVTAAFLAVPQDAARALVLQSAMPVAVNALVLAQEFNADPADVAATVAVTTLGAILTVPVTLALLPLVH